MSVSIAAAAVRGAAGKAVAGPGRIGAAQVEMVLQVRPSSQW